MTESQSVQQATPAFVDIVAAYAKGHPFGSRERCDGTFGCYGLHATPWSQHGFVKWYAAMTETQRAAFLAAVQEINAYNRITAQVETLLDTIRPQLDALNAERTQHRDLANAVLITLVTQTDHGIRESARREDAAVVAKPRVKRARRAYTRVSRSNA